MAATNMGQLEAMLRKEMQKAMRVASEKMLAETQGKVYEFYTEGDPKVYQRTGALGDTPKTTAITNAGNTSSFDVYLDQDYQYTTGSNPSMEEVLNLANSGIPFTSKNGYPAKPTLGKKGFWEASEKEIERVLDETMASFFGK